MTKEKSVKIPWVLLTNVLLIISIVIVFFIYNIDYQRRIKQQNINDIVNINQSTATISSAFFDAQSSRLKDICRYASNRQMTRLQLLKYIEASVSANNCSFQLIDSDYMGYLVLSDKNRFPEVNYTSTDYGELKKIFKEADIVSGDIKVLLSPEFTDNYTGCKSFALYCYIPVISDDGLICFDTLMSISNTANFVDSTHIDGGFDNYSSVLINESGNYILGNSAFKSTNFFQYLYVFNNLTRDEQKEIIYQVEDSHKGELYYKNSLKQDCVFVYTLIPQTQWYCISSVPLSSFHGQANDFRLTAFIAILLIMLTLIDVTWLKHLNTRLMTSAMEAEKASIAKTDFLSRMSHDIRTPLNVITGMTYMALQEKPDPILSVYLGNIQSAGKFLTGLVNDILDLNKVESGKMELHPAPYSLNEFIHYIDAIILPQCRDKDLSFVLEKNFSEDITIMTDSLRFNQIFFNLLSNAVKYTPARGHLLFSIQISEKDSNKIDMDFIIQDDGIGMSKEFQTHLFEAFSQENALKTSERSGTGLGLAIVKSLLDLMQGTINVDSTPTEGTTFHINLGSCVVPNEPKVQTHKSEASEDVLSGKRILLCEDLPMNIVIVKSLLEKKGMLIDVATDGKSGVEQFNASSPYYFNAVLMDIQMPVMNGIDATKEIRKLQRTDAQVVPIIALTANAYDIDIENSLEAGMNAHIAKPIDPATVYHTLAQLIAPMD